MPWLVLQELPPVLPVRVRVSAWPAGHKASAGVRRGQRPAAEAAERSRRGHPHPLARSGWRGPRTGHRPSRIPPVAVRPDRGRRGRGSAVGLRGAGRYRPGWFFGSSTEAVDPAVLAMLHIWGRMAGVPYTGPDLAASPCC